MARLSVSGRYAVAAVMAPSRRRAFPSLPSFSSLLPIYLLTPVACPIRSPSPIQFHIICPICGREGERTDRRLADDSRARPRPQLRTAAEQRKNQGPGPTRLSVYPMTTKPTQPSNRTEFCPHSSFRAKAEGGAGAGAVEGGREASARWG